MNTRYTQLMYTLIVDKNYHWFTCNWFYEISSGTDIIMRVDGYKSEHEAYSDGNKALDEILTSGKYTTIDGGGHD